jgi:hypothetical protein
MKVSLDGYKDWSFGNGTVVHIRLKPGETENIDVKLRRAASKHLD